MIVGLYIKVREQYDPSLELVVDRFKERVEDDGGTFEAGTCLQNNILSLGGVYGIGLNTVTDFSQRVLADSGTFESGNCLLQTINSLGGVAPAVAYRNVVKRIELFEDEKISITSSIQNINDISKVFTDYTQSFTIPASDNNNEIFRHWYENSLDNGFDQRLRYDGYIEIDTQTFRVGKWQIESASIKNNRVENYKITFYGELKSLTDKFGEDKLKDIQQLNNYTIEYTGANVQNSITTTGNPDVIFPLISSDRVWQYGGGSSQDISQNSHHIHYTELYPSLKVARIFDAIESKYGITLNGNFLSQSRFDLAYLWLKNNDSKVFNAESEEKVVTLTSVTSNPNFFIINNTNNLTINTFRINSQNGDATFKMSFSFPISVVSTIVIYKNGEFYTSLTQTGTLNEFTIDSNYGIGNYKFFIKTATATTYTYTYIAKYVYLGASLTLFNGSGSGNIATVNLNLSSYMPDMKVSDFFSGILKMFNLTAFSTDGVNFTLEQLEEWYYQGNIKDFSEYTTTDLDFERIKPYKKINFEYEKSENLLSRNFFTSNAREFGNLSYPFNNDGSEYTIKLPFENLMFQKFTGTNLQVGYALKSDFTTYAPKPIILYKYQNTSCSFYLNDGTTTNHITKYNVMGQDVIFNGLNSSLNWGIEISSYLLNPVSNSLFNNYYLAYLNNLYLLKSRMIKVSMRLPYLELLNLKLNDRIVIRDKRYIINSYTTDLTTFQSNFELIQDFRSIVPDNNQTVNIPNAGRSYIINIKPFNGLTWSVLSNPGGNMISGTIFYSNYAVTVGVNGNTTGVERIGSIQSNFGDIIVIIQAP